MRLTLASRSPRRRDLLVAAGFALDIRPADIDEAERPGEMPGDYVTRVASAKLQAARRAAPTSERVWLAADTTVCSPKGSMFGKPRDVDEARAMVETLTRGQPHRVITGWAIATDDTASEVHAETTTVWMRSLSAAELDTYLATRDWSDKAGGYGIQSHAASWVTRIEGSYTNVIGLPLAQVITRIHELRGRA